MFIIKRIEKIIVCFSASAVCACAFADSEVKEFPLGDVRLMENTRFYHAMETDREYIMAHDADRFLAPYLEEAGLPVAAPRYGGWESKGVGGQTGGHYLSALSILYAATGDEEALRRANHMVDVLAEVQAKNGTGFIGASDANKQVMQEFLDSAQKDSPTTHAFLGKYWVPWYTMHKIMKGLSDAYVYTGNEKAREVLLKYCDWVCEYIDNLNDKEMEGLLAVEYGGVNEVLAQASEFAGNKKDAKKYQKAAERFSQKALMTPMLERRDVLPGMHANTQIPKVLGFAEVARVLGANGGEYYDAAEFFWDTVINTQTLSNGGNSHDEHFDAAKQFSNFMNSRTGMETCNTYNMLRLSEKLFYMKPDAKYADFYERALINHILASQDPEHGGVTYFSPMRPGMYRVYSTVDCQGWCCIGTGFENHVKYGKFIFSHSDGALYVNLFIPSVLDWKERGASVTLKNNFPQTQKFEVELDFAELKNEKFDGRFELKIRKPWWVASDRLSAKINGTEGEFEVGADGYATIDRQWSAGDKISVAMPMGVYVERLKGDPFFAAIMCGPIMLAQKVSVDGETLHYHWGEEGVPHHIPTGRFLDISKTPFILTEGEDISRYAVPSSDGEFAFEIKAKITADKNAVRLVPINEIHHSRYNAYFGFGGLSDYEKFKAKYEDKSVKERAKLDLRALDSLIPGQQQPEVDHNMRVNNSNSGHGNDGRTWRDARGFFEYEFLTDESGPIVLFAEYFGGDSGGRDFVISVNGTDIAEESLTGRPVPYYFTEYEIPESVQKSAGGKYVVRFTAKPNNTAGGIFGLGIAKAKAE